MFADPLYRSNTPNRARAEVIYRNQDEPVVLEAEVDMYRITANGRSSNAHSAGGLYFGLAFASDWADVLEEMQWHLQRR